MACQAVTFNYALWQAMFPELGAIPITAATGYFMRASILFANPSRVVSDPNNLLTLLNLLTAHIAALNNQGQGQQSPGSPLDPTNPVGRISNATEGSVSVQTQNDYPPGTPQWYQQTRYGSEFWTATAQYRTMRYERGQLQPGAVGPGLFGFDGGW